MDLKPPLLPFVIRTIAFCNDNVKCPTSSGLLPVNQPLRNAWAVYSSCSRTRGVQNRIILCFCFYLKGDIFSEPFFEATFTLLSECTGHW